MRAMEKCLELKFVNKKVNQKMFQEYEDKRRKDGFFTKVRSDQISQIKTGVMRLLSLMKQ